MVGFHPASILLLACVVIQVLAIFFLLQKLRRMQLRERGNRTTVVEKLVSDFSARVAASSPERLNEVIESAMADMLAILGGGRICWYVNHQGSSVLERVYSSAKPGFAASPALVRAEDIPHTFARLMRGETVIINGVQDLPVEAGIDKRYFEQAGLNGLLLSVSNCGGDRKGILAVAYMPAEFHWTEESETQFAVFNNLIVATMERQAVYNLLDESEKRFRYLFQTAPIGIALEDLEGHLLFVNPALCSILGYPEHELRKMRCSQLSDPETNHEEETLFNQLQQGVRSGYTIEKVFQRKNGTRIWGRVDVALLQDGSGQPPLVVGMMEDITGRRSMEQELKRAHSELEQLAGYLIQAQDEERHRISRELHDDIGQRLALMSVEFDLLSQSLDSQGWRDERDRVQQLKSHADALTSDVHQLSHQLHSTKLQHLGLRAALEELVRHVEKQRQISVDFHTSGPDTLLSPEVALCLFRVAQEALNNVVRHSRSSDVMVTLEVEDETAKLVVQDSGIGFDVSSSSGGLGMISMRERLRIVGGDFFVQSRRGGGTMICAAAPVTKRRDAIA